MEPFTIQCTTCKARLIVKDESVIGDILACPKCHSMVQVVPPVGWKRPGGDSSPDQAVAAEAVQSPPTPAPAKRSAAQKAAAVLPPALPPSNSTEQAASDPVETCGESTAAAAPVAASNWTLLGGSLVAGVVLGAAVWFVMATMSSAPQIAADSPRSTQETIDPAVPPPTSDAKTPPAPARPVSPSENTPPAASAPLAEAAASEAAAADKPASEDSEHAAAEATRPAEVGDEPTETEPGPAKESVPALKLEPVTAPTIVAGGAASDTAAALPVDAPSAADAPPEDDAAAPQAAVSDTAPPEPARLARDEIERRLAVALAEVEFADVTLAQFATFIADVTGVPVSFDEAALSRAGLGRGTKITISLRAGTADAALRAAIERAGLTYTVSDGRIVVTAQSR